MAESRKVALVTGSARGIGLATVKRLSAAGLSVIGVDLRPQNSDACDRFFQVDLANPTACQELVAELARSGGVDILVNNAGLLIRQRISEVTTDDVDRTFAVNFRAPFLLAQGLVERMREVRWGRIVNVSSIGARTGGLGTNSIYAASKAALISLTKNFARAYGSDGITVNAIAPGGVDTPMSEESGPEVRARIASEIPIGRLGRPEEAAAVIEFLASEAASWINGVTLDVNGGWVMV